jgi:N-acetylglutamate synthase-like GNAT family acetyltransferase
MKSNIRLYHKNDKQQCLDTFKSNVPDFFSENEIADFEAFLDRLETGIPKTQFFVIEDENRIVGCGGFGDKDNKNIISLAWGHIHKNEHKKGLGQQLLTYRLALIKQLFPQLTLTIDTTQFSYGFYEKNGFRLLKITENYYTEGMYRYDMEFTK